MRGSGGRSATGGSRRRGPGAGARLGALLLVLGACSDGGWSGTSDLVAEGTVPAGEPQDPAPDDLGFGELVLPWDEEVLGEDAVAPPDLEGVESMRLASLTLEVVSPEGGDLSFVSLAGFYVRADGIDEALLGSQDRFPAGESVVTLDLEDVDLLPYSRAGGVRILVRGGGSMPAAETTLRARITIESSVDDARACDELTGG